MTELLARIGSIADSPDDGDEMRLKHRILLFSGLLMSGGGLLWGCISFVFGLYWESMVPFGYVVLTAVNYSILAATKNFPVARYLQVSISLLLPFVFQWVLGGFVTSGAMLVWAMLCLLGSLTFDDSQATFRWLGMFIVLTLFSGLIDPYLTTPEVIQDPALSTLFSVMNIVVVTTVVFGLTVFFVRQREIALDELAVRNRQIAESQQALVQSEKLAALGQLVAGVAHELNTPLGAINASIDNLEHSIQDTLTAVPGIVLDTNDAEKKALLALIIASNNKNVLASSREERAARRVLRESLTEHGYTDALPVLDLLVDLGVQHCEPVFQPIFSSQMVRRIVRFAHDFAALRRSSANIKVAAERSAKIVFALKSYAHPGGTGEGTEGDLGAHIDTVLTLYHNKLKRGIEVTRSYSDNGVIEARHDQLNQVWTNLVHNAIQAMDYEGQLTIEVADVEGGVEVSVTDNGPGIPPAAQQQIFEPFFTTKSAGEGSGLGLSICRDIVRRHQGSLTVQSQPGHTRFTVSLPRICRVEEAA